MRLFPKHTYISHIYSRSHRFSYSTISQHIPPSPSIQQPPWLSCMHGILNHPFHPFNQEKIIIIIIIMGEEPTIISGLMILFCFLQRIQMTNGTLKEFSGAAQVTERCQTISIVTHFGLQRQRIRGTSRRKNSRGKLIRLGLGSLNKLVHSVF